MTLVGICDPTFPIERNKMTDSYYLLARDIMDETEYREDGKVKYWSKYLNRRTGEIVWHDQSKGKFLP